MFRMPQTDCYVGRVTLCLFLSPLTLLVQLDAQFQMDGLQMTDTSGCCAGVQTLAAAKAGGIIKKKKGRQEGGEKNEGGGGGGRRRRRKRRKC